MPTYEYICENEHPYQEVRSIFADQEAFECLECGAKLKRVFESTPVTFEGDGFYAKERRKEFGL